MREVKLKRGYLLRSPSPSPAVSHGVSALLHHKILALKICFALVPVSKQAAQVPLPSFRQARGCETTELWAKQVELSQKSLQPGAAQSEFSNNFVSFFLLLHFSASLHLPQPPCTEVPCLEAFRASRNPATRRSEDIIRAARLSALSLLPCRFTPQSLALHQTKPGCLRPLGREGGGSPFPVGAGAFPRVQYPPSSGHGARYRLGGSFAASSGIREPQAGTVLVASFNSPRYFPLSGDNLPWVGLGYTESSGFRLLLFATKIHRRVEDGDGIEGQCDQCGKYFFGEWGELLSAPFSAPA